MLTIPLKWDLSPEDPGGHSKATLGEPKSPHGKCSHLIGGAIKQGVRCALTINITYMYNVQEWDMHTCTCIAGSLKFQRITNKIKDNILYFRCPPPLLHSILLTHWTSNGQYTNTVIPRCRLSILSNFTSTVIPILHKTWEYKYEIYSYKIFMVASENWTTRLESRNVKTTNVLL